MSKHRVMVLKIVAKQLSVTEAAERNGLSRRQIRRLLARFREGGVEAVDLRSRRANSNSRSTPSEIVERVVDLRGQLLVRGLNAGRSRSAGTCAAKAFRSPTTTRRPMAPGTTHDSRHTRHMTRDITGVRARDSNLRMLRRLIYSPPPAMSDRAPGGRFPRNAGASSSTLARRRPFLNPLNPVASARRVLTPAPTRSG